MLTKNQRGRFDKKLKAYGFNSKERHAILDRLARDLEIHVIQPTEISLGYFEVSEDGKTATPNFDMDNADVLFCFAAKYSDLDYIGYPHQMARM